MTDVSQDSKKLEILPVSGQAELPAEQERRAFFGVVPNLEHESEQDFLRVREELAAESIAGGLLFGHQIGHELAVARRNISRYRPASLACLNADPRARPPPPADNESSIAALREWARRRRTGEERITAEEMEALEARVAREQAMGPPPPLPDYEQMREEIDALTDTEMRRYEEDLNLMSGLSHSHKLLQEMAQNAIANGAANQKTQGRLNIDCIGKLPNKYLTDKRKFTRPSQIILDEPPLLPGESRLDYDTILLDAMEFCGGDSVTELIAAQDIVNDTLQIHRELQQREQPLARAYSLAMGRQRDRRYRAAKFGNDHVEAAGRANHADNQLIDPNLILAFALHEKYDGIKQIDRQIDRIRHRRRRTIENAVKRRGSRLRLMSPSRDMKLIK